MITLKELNFVNSWASNAPYPGEQYAEQAILKLIKSVEAYEKFYKDKVYDFVLSNGEQFEFEVYPMNLCHMLGIDYKRLCSKKHSDFRNDVLGLPKTFNSYGLLKSLTENIEDVLRYDREESKAILNYYRIMIKCSIFEKISDFERFNFGVINFDKETYKEGVGHDYCGHAEKFLYVQSSEQTCPYFMMGIVPDGSLKNGSVIDEDVRDIRKYAVETLVAPSNVRDFFNCQRVAIPTQILATTAETMTKAEATPSDKLALLNQYHAITTEYNIPNNMDIYGDYIATLSSMEKPSILIKK